MISIHAPRVGSDVLNSSHGEDAVDISIHAPRVGSDKPPFAPSRDTPNFYPRSPRGERHAVAGGVITMLIISIHAPRVGSDDKKVQDVATHAKFLSTLPAWGATFVSLVTFKVRRNFYPRSPRGERLENCENCKAKSCISIHAPRVGSDLCGGHIPPQWRYFYPRSPRGERHGAGNRQWH